MAQSLRIGPAEVKQRMDAGEQIVFVDSRNPAAWGATDQKIPGALRMGVGEVAANINQILEGVLIASYCT